MKISELLHDIGRPVAYSPKLAVLIGVKECVLLSQLIYWSDKAETGWIYKSSAELEEETGLSYHEQSSTRKALIRSGLLQVRHDRQQHRFYFQVQMGVLDEIWEQKRSLRPGWRVRKMGVAVALNVSGGSCVERSSPAALNVRGQLRSTQVGTNTETTVTETTSKGATSAPGFKDFVDQWFNAFQECFGEPYDGSMMGKDGKHLSRLLKAPQCRQVDELISIAKRAWARHSEFGFGMSTSIAGFCTNLNTIVAKLATNGKGNPEGTNRVERLSSPIL